MAPVSKKWCLDSEAEIDIWRRGFPLVPNFSTTIDWATGQTMKAAIPDLGNEFAPATQTAAMRGYIALSRVTEAAGLLVAQPFNPMLFQSGQQAWPTLLFEHLLGNVPQAEFQRRCEEAAAKSREKEPFEGQAVVMQSMPRRQTVASVLHL